MKHLTRLNTVGRIAEKVGEPIRRVRYILDSRQIQAVALAGNAKLYDESAVRRVRYEINLLDARRPRRG